MTWQEEQKIKLSRLYGIMDQRGLDAIYLKRQDNFSWLTCGGINYVGLGEMGNVGLLVTRDNLYAITNHIEAGCFRQNKFRAETLRLLLNGIR